MECANIDGQCHSIERPTWEVWYADSCTETLFAEVGEIKEVDAEYIFFWNGRKSEERREAGVGFAIKTELVCNLSRLP